MKLDYERQQIFFTGQVQGVGFRYTAHRMASRHPVTGFVRNLPDGRVELVAEGDSAEIDRFVRELRTTMADHIRHCDVHRIPASGEFDGFEIRF